MRHSLGITLAALAGALLARGGPALAAEAGKYISYPPTRPLPVTSARPMAAGPAFYVDAAKGDDAADGSKERPWKTVSASTNKLKAGDTLCLRGGVYYEHVVVQSRGGAEKPITIRAFPNELAVIDGGLREFFDSPATAWEPCPGGVKDEFQSTKTYAVQMARKDSTNAWGNFGDSMVPLQGYRLRCDLQSDSMFWQEAGAGDEPAAQPAKDKKASKGAKVKEEMKVYCGPGVWFNTETQRIHARLAHTNLECLHEENYRGETDPRKVPLVVALRGAPVLAIEDSRNVILQDIVLRGAVESCLLVDDSQDIAADGVTTYGGGSSVVVRFTKGFRMNDCAVRGPAAPWIFRSSLKYRSVESSLISASGWHPNDNSDFDLGYSEFTDSCDGIFVGGVANVKLHHSLLDNCGDDGIFLTCGTTFDGRSPGGPTLIYQNHISRVLTPLVFGVGHGRQKTTADGFKQIGAGVWVFRNVFDQRRPDMYFPPHNAREPQELGTYGRLCGDHGGPTWESMCIYNNLFVSMDAAWRNYYAGGLGGAAHPGNKCRLFDNIFVQAKGLPGFVFAPSKLDLQADGNLFWSEADGPAFAGDVFAKFRGSKVFTESKARYAPGWTANDLFADPKLKHFSADWRQPVDLAPQPGSAAFDAGLPVPPEWPDPLRAEDAGKPDIGPLPAGVKVWGVGVHGRFNPFTDCK